MSINPEQITQEARRTAREWEAERRRRAEEDKVRLEQARRDSQERQAEFEARRPALIEQARGEHETRFASLKKILDPLGQPLQELRDKWFPGSPIVVVDRYDNWYTNDPDYENGNVYYRALMIPDIDSQKGSLEGVFAVYAICREFGAKQFFGLTVAPKRTEFSIGVGYHRDYPPLPKDKLEHIRSLASIVKNDFEQISPEDDIFEIVPDSRVYFVSHSWEGCSLSLDNIKFDLGKEIPTDVRNATEQLNRRFTEVLTFVAKGR